MLKSSGKPEEEVARKPEKKKRRFQPTGKADCWFGKKEKLREEKVHSLIRTFLDFVNKVVSGFIEERHDEIINVAIN